MRFLLPILLVLSLASCGTSTGGVGGGGYGPKHYQCIGEGHKPGTDKYINCMSKVTTSISQDGQTCKNYGFKEGTDKFAECLMRIAENKRQTQIAAQQRQQQFANDLMRRGGAGLGCSQYGGGLATLSAMATGQCNPPPQPKNQPIQSIIIRLDNTSDTPFVTKISPLFL